MDNITGFGGGSDEISLGLTINSNVGGTINDFNTLDQVLQQIVKDEETFKGIQNDSFEQAKAHTQELRSAGEAGQQLISIFRALRGEQQGTVQDAKQLASVYQQVNNELQKANQNKARLGITSPGVGGVPGAGLPGSTPPTGPSGGVPGTTPATQTGGAGGGGIQPPTTRPTAGFADEPDDFFGREEAKSGARGKASRSAYDPSEYSGIDPLDLENINLERPDALGTGGRGGPGGSARRPGLTVPTTDEKYKKLSDLAWTIFPNRGYYRNMRRVRWLTRNEGGAINKFVTSKSGQRVGMALNRLGGGNYLRTNEGYQLFPFAQDENGNYVDTNNNVVNGKYGLQDSSGQWIQSTEGGLEGPAWAWNGEGTPPPIPPGVEPQQFNPWERPNLTATGEGAAKVAGAAFVARAIKAKGGDLFREGQLYTGITGGTGIMGALGYDIGAQLTSWFGLNPLESYGQAKQITMQNLALGYRGNLLNQANAFGNQALQKYGVDPQTSMQMFGQMVMQAGATLDDLNTSLETLAHTASTTDTSFAQLQQGVIQYSQIGSSIGLTGGQNAIFATSAAQFAAGQPTLGATEANPADILDSMVGQALVAQQMGTSYLGLPQAASQQGAGALLDSVVKVNESLMNRIGLTKGNYKDEAALQNAYFKFQLLMNALGRKKEANMGFKAYKQFVGNTFSGKAQKEYHKTLTNAYAQDVGGFPGETPGEAIANAISKEEDGIGGGRFGAASVQKTNALFDEMQHIESQKKWKNIGVFENGRFLSLSDIEKLPIGRRTALEARIATGDQPISHINKHGKRVIGNYANSTLLDLQGRKPEQQDLFGVTPNRAAMHGAERGAMTIELGPNAKKLFMLLDNPSNFNRYINNWAKTHGIPTTDWGNQRSGNN